MNDLKPCAGTSDLSQQEATMLDGLPNAAHDIDVTALTCELQAGHVGPHLALGQSYGPQDELNRWLRWAGEGQRDWVDIGEDDMCAADGPPLPDVPGELDMCLLPAAHPGAHSFDLG